MKDCLYCSQDEKRAALMVPVCSLECSIVYLVKNQNFPGRCVVALTDHKEEIFQLTARERQAFFDDVSVTAQAICSLYAPDKLNYAIYGDGVPHLHVHIVPKKRDGFCWGGPFAMDGNNHILTDEEAGTTAAAIAAEIRRLNPQQGEERDENYSN